MPVAEKEKEVMDSSDREKVESSDGETKEKVESSDEETSNSVPEYIKSYFDDLMKGKMEKEDVNEDTFVYMKMKELSKTGCLKVAFSDKVNASLNHTIIPNTTLIFNIV